MKKWEVLNKTILNNDVDFEKIIKILLENRGVKTKNEMDDFFDYDLEKINAKDVGIDSKDLLKSLNRIKKAIEKKEQIIVFGDYDVDGITASAIVWETLNSIGGNIMPYIPNRVTEGYGLSEIGIENALLKYPDIKLIITVDNGIVATSAVEFANKKGIDVIITDHHVSAKNNPPAFSIIHSTKICGAAVAYFFSKYMEEKIKGKTDRKKHLDLVSVATVADVMELKGFNRKLLASGLPYLRSTKRIGLQKLFEISKIDPSKIGVYEIGHIIAPRINATGRMGDAIDSLRLICTKDEKKAKELANRLNNINVLRQNLTFTSFEVAKSKVSKKGKLIFSYSEDFEPGIIGLISGKLTEEFYRPSIVFSVGKEKSKASARSVSGFNIIEFIRLHSEFLLEAGGHPMAAGFTIETKRLTEFKKILLELAEKNITDELLIRKLKIDLEIPLEIIDLKFYEKILNLAPFGFGNPEPTFLSKRISINDIRKVGKDGKHLKLELSCDKGSNFGAILFGYDNELNLNVNDEIDVVYSLSLNEWNGSRKIELKIKDVVKSLC